MVQLKVCVNKKDIMLGTRRHSSLCPIGRALARSLGFGKQSTQDIINNGVISVGIDEEFDLDVTVNIPNGLSVRLNVPKVVKEFVNRFDESGPEGVKPFSFNVKIPNRVARKILAPRKYFRLTSAPVV